MNDLHPGVLHFPLDCAMDDAVKLIQAEYGLIGFAVVVKLYQKIYGERGYYCEWTRDVALLFSQQNGVGYNVVSEIVGACLRRGIFCEDLFDRYQILTSHGIQKRYLRIVSRRIGEKILPGYALVPCAQKQSGANKNEENVCKNPENVCSESIEREKESKENNSLSNACAHAHGKHQNVILAEEEYADICSRIPDADTYIDHFSEKLYQKGYQYSNHHDSILEWYAKDKPRLERMRRKSAKEPPKPGELGNSFDTDDFLEAAIKRTENWAEIK